MADLVKLVETETKNIVEILAQSETLPLPAELKKDFAEVSLMLKENKTVVDLYGKQLAEIPFSQSSFLDVCVQFEDHFTPHRKLRQALLELDSRLRALYAAKDGYNQQIIKYKKILLNIEKYEKELNNDNLDDYQRKLIELKIEELNYNKEKIERELRSTYHLVKDAVLKVIEYKNMIVELQKEVEKTGLSYEESEMIYYVMYLTRDAEVQLRTMGRIDTGTFMAISQMPGNLRKKILRNIEFIKQKINDGDVDDYIFKKYWDYLLPERTGENEFEGVKLEELIKYKPIKILALTEGAEETDKKENEE